MFVENVELQEYPIVNIKAHWHKYDIEKNAYDFIQTYPNYNSTFDQIFDTENIELSLLNRLNNIKQLCLTEWQTDQNRQNTQMLIDAYLKVGSYCRTKCQSTPTIEFLINLITSICKAMVLGSIKAIQLFPCLLAYSNSELITEELLNIFQDEVTYQFF